MSEQANLVTTCTFKGKEYLVKMNIINGNTLEMCVTDKYTAEDWQCCYDATYIENITHKTGNFKQFDIFITMLKSGLLKTSECVSLDLLTYDDLEMLRSRRVAGRNGCPPHSIHSNHLAPASNRRYLILTYTVEFDRIHYPLPMEYCGPPDPQILQGIIHRLEGDVERLQEQLHKQSGQPRSEAIEQISKLEKRVQELTKENRTLTDEVRFLNKSISKRSSTHRQVEFMQGAMRSLEEQVLRERSSFQRLVRRLREEKAQLFQQVEELQYSDRILRNRLRNSFRGGNLPHPGLGPGISQHVDRPKPLTSRHPGDDLGSPGFVPQKLRNKEVPRSPSWGRTLQEHNNSLRQVKPTLISTIRTASPSQTRSIGCFQSVRHRRSSSESSCGSRKCMVPQSTTVRKVNNSLDETAQIAATLQKMNSNSVRGRQKQKVHQSRKRSTSGSSAGSVALEQLRGNHRKKSGNGSRHSSASSASSQRKPARQESPGQGDHKLIRPTKFKSCKTQDLKLGMSDLETRIQALQKLLKEGLYFK